MVCGARGIRLPVDTDRHEAGWVVVGDLVVFCDPCRDRGVWGQATGGVVAALLTSGYFLCSLRERLLPERDLFSSVKLAGVFDYYVQQVMPPVSAF